jgi:hypothetical protein
MDKPLLPALPSAVRGEKPIALFDGGFLPGDLVHVKADLSGWPANTVLPVLGQNACYDAQGHIWRLVAYLPLSRAFATTYAGRDAARFPEPGQRESWFSGVQMYFTELDITDHAHELALERRREAMVIQLYPERQQRRRAA